MFSIANSSVSLLLILLSLVLAVWNRKAWLSAKNGLPAGGKGLADSAANQRSAQRDIAFAWRQFRRRVQASLMIGLVGIAIFVGQFLETPRTIATFWAGVILLLFWILALAMADILATQQHFGRVHRGHVAEQVRIQAEMLRQSNSSPGELPQNCETAADESTLAKRHSER